MPDHVHLFLNVLPDTAAHQVANAIKGRSSSLVRQEFIKGVETTRIANIEIR
jgi:putative transposase